VPISLHPVWHPLTAHFAIGLTMSVSGLIIVGLIARLIGKRDFAEHWLTKPIHVASLLSIWAIIIVGATAMIDFPASAFAASAWFRFKTTMAIASFFIYLGIYYTVASRGEKMWSDNASLAYTVILALLGAFAITLLGAAGGYLTYGHSVMEPLLKMMGLPMPRA
jgi:hypothetical protein